jgi:hypothetical protein
MSYWPDSKAGEINDLDNEFLFLVIVFIHRKLIYVVGHE